MERLLLKLRLLVINGAEETQCFTVNLEGGDVSQTIQLLHANNYYCKCGEVKFFAFQSHILAATPTNAWDVHRVSLGGITVDFLKVCN